MCGLWVLTRFIDYRTTDVGDRVREITDGQGVDAVLDVVGTDSATEKLHLLAFGGRIATAAGDPDFSEVNSLDTGLSWFWPGHRAGLLTRRR